MACVEVLEESMEDVNCSVCGVACAKAEWFDHLLTKPHLRKSRKSFLEGEGSERKRSVLLFSNFPLVDSKEGCEHGGGEGGVFQDTAGVVTFLQKCEGKGVVISNFFGWEEKPLVGVLQLKKRKMVNQLVKAFRGQPIQKGQPVEVKLDESHTLEIRKLTSIGPLEMRQMLPHEPVILPFEASEPVEGLDSPQEELADESLLILDECVGGTEELHRSIVTLDDTLPSEAGGPPDIGHPPLAKVTTSSKKRKPKKKKGERNRCIFNLNRLVKRRKWPVPEATFSEVHTSTKVKYLCHLRINGKTYNVTPTQDGVASTKLAAHQKVAFHCLKILRSTPTTSSVQASVTVKIKKKEKKEGTQNATMVRKRLRKKKMASLQREASSGP